MNNSDVLAVREFRRFANAHIYQDENIKYSLLSKINKNFNTDNISFIPTPQPMIIFYNGNRKDNIQYVYTEKLHIILAGIFIEFFNEPQTQRLIRNKIYNEIHNEEMKLLLNSTLTEIQLANPSYIALLFNMTIPKDPLVYVYL